MADVNSKPLVELKGQVERITYSDQKSGFTVAQVQAGERADLITVVGTLMAPAPGTLLEMKGRWVEHPDFGRQFRASQCHAQTPVTKQGIEKYLGSGLIKGIGPEMARRIVGRFGSRTLAILDQDPKQLTGITGIGPKRAAMIQRAWAEHQEIRQTMLFLHSHGVGTAQAMSIFRHYGQRTIAMIQQNPYRLARDIFGIGFTTADRMASQLGLASDSPMRVKAGIRHVLQGVTEDGHLYYPYDELAEKTQALLKTTRDPVGSAIAEMAADRDLVIEDHIPNGHQGYTQAVYLAHLYRCETFTAQHLRKLLKAPLFKDNIPASRALTWIKKQLKIELAQEQQQAVTASLTQKVLVITGGPGTGKTTIVQAITRLYEHLRADVLLAAPTGRAAKRLSEATGRPAKTIHRLLAYSPIQGQFQKNDRNPLQGDLLVIDEASMIDAVLMYHLMKALPVATTLILVGDVNQLPSVGPGNVLKDILASRVVPQVTLTDIFRQARSSRIVVNAHRINSGQLPNLEISTQSTISDFYFIEQPAPEKIVEIILALAGERIPRRFGLDPVDDIQLLTPMYRGLVGADNLNQQLQAHLNPQEAYVSRGSVRFSRYDKVMQVTNNYDKDIFNGDIGRIVDIEPRHKKLTIRFDDRLVSYSFEELNEVVLAYAVTIHKSQGSEYPAVIIPVTTQHYMLLQRNLIYTAITRAKQLVVMVGTKQAMAMAIKNNKPHQRHTRLAQRLQT